MRAALQFLMRHMVKRAVMRSPIKRALGLADLERAQAMIYKLVVNELLEEPSGGKAKPGETMQIFDCTMLTGVIFQFRVSKRVQFLIKQVKQVNLHICFLFLSLRSEK